MREQSAADFFLSQRHSAQGIHIFFCNINAFLRTIKNHKHNYLERLYKTRFLIVMSVPNFSSLIFVNARNIVTSIRAFRHVHFALIILIIQEYPPTKILQVQCVSRSVFFQSPLPQNNVNGCGISFLILQKYVTSLFLANASHLSGHNNLITL